MATFQELQDLLGYDLLTTMQKDLGVGGPSAGYFMDNPENPGIGSYYGTKQASALGGFDPAAFNGYDFNWQDTGGGNTGTLTGFKGGKQVGQWSQKDEQLSESLTNAAMLAAAAFGGIGLAGGGPLGGLLGGSGAAGGIGANAAGHGAFLGEAAWAPTAAGGAAGAGAAAGGAAGLSGLDAAMVDMGAGLSGGAGGAVAGAGAGGGMLGTIGKAAGGLLDFAKANPNLAGAVLGGLLGGTGSSGGGGYKYTGPMPTITQGGWKPSVNASLMQVQNQAPALGPMQANPYSGLLRFGG